MRLLVGFGDGLAESQTARIVVLDDGDGNARGEIPHGTPSSIGVNVIVVAHGLAAELFGMGEPVLVQRIQVESCLLMRVLAIPQQMGAIPRTRVCLREHGILIGNVVIRRRLVGGDAFRLRPLFGRPLVDGRVIGGCVGESLGGEPATLLKAEPATVFDALGHQRIVSGIGNDGDCGAVLRRCANHGRATDIDFLDGVRLIRTGTDGIRERIQVDHHQVERLDAQRLQLLDMRGVGHIGKDARMNVRIKGLDTAVKAFREAGDFTDLGHVDTKFGETLGGRTGGDDFSACGDERLCKHVDAFLVEYGYEGPFNRPVR